MVENLFLGGQTFIFHGFGAHGIFRSPNFEITLRHMRHQQKGSTLRLLVGWTFYS